MHVSEDYPFSDLLKQFRVRARLNQKEVAEKLEVHINTYGAWERGNSRPQNTHLVNQLASIFRLSDEDSDKLLKANSQISPILWNVPHLRNAYFTGREDILQQLSVMLSTDKTATLTQALSGLGGIGKTHTAIEYAYRQRDKYRAILWVRADSHETLVLDFVALAHLLNLPEKDAADQNIVVEAVKSWLDTHTQWLLILDNAESVRSVGNFLPITTIGHILLTTRAQAQGTIARCVEVEEMNLTEGALFLLRRAKVLAPEAQLDQSSETDRASAEQLVQLLGGLPLALDQAGAYIEETGCGVSEYLDRFSYQRTQLLERRGNLASDHLDSVTLTFTITFEKVAQINPTAVELLLFFAFLYPDAIPEELISQAGEDFGPALHALAGDLLALDKAIAALRSYSLIRRMPETKTFSIHRLVQTVLKESIDESMQRQWAERVVRAVSLVFPNSNLATWSQCQRYLPQVQICMEYCSQYGLIFSDAVRLLGEAGTYYFSHAQYMEAEPLLEYVLTISEQADEPSHYNTMACLSNLAMLYRAQGRYRQAEPLMKRSLEIIEQDAELQDLDRAIILNNWGGLYYEQGQYEHAGLLFQQALELFERSIGPQNPQTAKVLECLGELTRAQGQYIQAESYTKRALTIYEQTWGQHHPDTATGLNNLGLLYYDWGKYKLAEQLHKRALQIREQVLGLSHVDTAQSLNNLALLYHVLGQYEVATQLYQRALRIREEVLGTEHIHTAQSLNNLAGLYSTQSKHTQAEPLFRRALTIYEQAPGTEHPEVITTLSNLAMLCMYQDRIGEAEALAERAFDFSERMLGPQHLYTATSLNNLFSIYTAQGKYEQAESVIKRAFTIYEQILGPQHLDVATALNNLATLYSIQGKPLQAKPIMKRALTIYEQVLGPDNPNTLLISENDHLLEEML